MKFLLILLFLFSSYCFPNSIEGKSLLCGYPKEKNVFLDFYAYMFIQKKIIFLSIDLKNDKYILKKAYSTKEEPYFLDAKNIYIRIHPGSLLSTINRETLVEITKAGKIILENKCSVFEDEESLLKRFDEIINQFQKIYDAKRINNKI